MRWRRRRRATPSPAAPARLELRLERERYFPGETVRGSVVVPESGAGGIEISLDFRERSTEYETVAVTVPGSRLEGDLAPGSVHRFAIDLPRGALPSQRSRHGELWWTVDARVAGATSDLVAGARIDVAALPPTQSESDAPVGLGAGRSQRD